MRCRIDPKQVSQKELRIISYAIRLEVAYQTSADQYPTKKAMSAAHSNFPLMPRYEPISTRVLDFHGETGGLQR